MGFLENVIERAKKERKKIVLPETADIRIIEAAQGILKKEIADVVLIGRQKDILELAGDRDISGAQIIEPAEYVDIENYAEKLYELRKHKGMSREDAAKLVLDPLYFAVMMIKTGAADGMVAGAINSTANTLRPALQILKTAPGTKLVSSFFIMNVPDCEYGDNGLFLFSDCGLNEAPDKEQLSEIAISSAASFESLTGGKARVGMLSYSTYGSAASEMTSKVLEATKLVREKAPYIEVDGELQADAAIIPSVAEKKAKGSKTAGKCNTLIFPDLNSGNIAYKLVQRLAKADAYGPVTQGLAAPVNDLSRGCSADDIIGVAAITAVQAQKR